ncbi:MAG TPA: hypothetical protein VHZ74_19620 [Bryobacteraceae bacterium]|jgi:hypothetical protein|nr:hypothetical protein [Bryobacteraceae bacterium]
MMSSLEIPRWSNITEYRSTKPPAATGDIFVTTSYPYIDIENGGGIEGEIDVLNGAPQES